MPLKSGRFYETSRKAGCARKICEIRKPARVAALQQPWATIRNAFGVRATACIALSGSVPHVPLVEFDRLANEQRAQLVLEPEAAVMLFLVSDVLRPFTAMGLADGECSVAGLPVELFHPRLGILHPQGGDPLEFLVVGSNSAV